MEIANNNLKQCEICKIEATSLCLECISYYCDECYKYVHNKKENKNHKKEQIDYFVPIDTKCPEHSKRILDLFCIDEKGNPLKFCIIILHYRTLLFLLSLS